MQNVWFTIFTLGVGQGLFLIIALLVVKGKQKIIRLLLYIIIFELILVLYEWLNFIYPTKEIIFLYRKLETLPLLIGPLFWFYAISIIKEDFKFNYKLFLHFLPFLFFLILSLPFHLKSNAFKLQYLEWMENNPIPLKFALFSWLKGLHSFIYLLFSWIAVKKHLHKPGIKINNRFNIKRLNRLIIFQLTIIFCIYLMVTIEYFNFSLPFHADRIGALLITFSFFIYAFAIIISPHSITQKKASINGMNKYLSSTLKEPEKLNILNRLNQVLENNKPFLNPDLTLTQLSEIVGTSSNQLSQVINEKYDKNFHQFINNYRVEEVKRNINNNQKTLYGIALDCGFNSKSAFNRIFKDLTNMTPSQYKKSLNK